MKIKNWLIGTLAAMCFTSSAWSYTISNGSTDVGALDTLIEITTARLGDNNGDLPGSGDTSNSNIITWAENSLDGLVELELVSNASNVRYMPVDGFNRFDTSSPNYGIVAFELLTEADYFIIENGLNWALFRNNASLEWGVFNLLPVNAVFTTNLPIFTHTAFQIIAVKEYNTPAAVPVPAAAWLFCSALLGLVGLARQRQLSRAER